MAGSKCVSKRIDLTNRAVDVFTITTQ